MKPLRLLALSGSLRKQSYNAAALHALRSLSPSHVDITIGDIACLPLFNPDREHELIPVVTELKSRVLAADGLIIASPEYAHGISGPMKNALDWLVSGEEIPNKPVLLINTSPRAHHALDALREVLLTMSARLMQEPVTIPLLSSGLDAEGIVAKQEIADTLRSGFSRFCEYIGDLRLE